MSTQIFKPTGYNPLKEKLSKVLFESFEKAGLKIEQNDIFLALEETSSHYQGELSLKTFIFKSKYGIDPKKILSTIHLKMTLLLEFVHKVEAKLPYINFSMRYNWIEQDINNLNELILPKLESPIRKIVVEHTQPNTHKSLHVGHLRNTILGDSVYRLLKIFSKECYAVDYHGDEGAHVTKVVWYIKINNINLTSIENSNDFNSITQWLNKKYSEANIEVDKRREEDKKSINSELASVLRNIEARTGEDYAIWKKTREWSIAEFREVYKWLDVEFDSFYSESLVSEGSQARVDEYLQKGILQESEGAIGIDLKDVGLGFCMLRKTDGTGLYATKDVELAIRRNEDFEADTYVYVVDQRQSLHFQQAFETVKRMGFNFAERCFHLGYDIVQGKDGTLSSRTGNALSADQLINDMLQKSRDIRSAKKRDNSDPEEEDYISHQVALSALRYGMLKVDPLKKVTFNAEEWAKYEGDTGPYLLYSCARAMSVLKTAQKNNVIPVNNFSDIYFAGEMQNDQRRMLSSILSFYEVLENSAATLKPNNVCNHVLKTSQYFNAQYASVRLSNKAKYVDDAPAMLLIYKIYIEYMIVAFDVLGWKAVENI